MEGFGIEGMASKVHGGSIATRCTTCEPMEEADQQCHCVSKDTPHRKAAAGSRAVRSDSAMGYGDLECAGQGSSVHANSVGEANRQRTVVATQKTATAKELGELLVSQGYECAACRRGLSPDTAEIDHLIPRSDGGGHAATNLQWLCKPCNRAKGSLSMDEFVDMCRRIAAHAAPLPPGGR